MTTGERTPMPQDELALAREAYGLAFSGYLSHKGINPQAVEAIERSGHTIDIRLDNTGNKQPLTILPRLQQFIEQAYENQPLTVDKIFFSRDNVVMDLTLPTIPHEPIFPRGATDEAEIQFIFEEEFDNVTCYAFGTKTEQESKPSQKSAIEKVMEELDEDTRECPPAIVNDLATALTSLSDNKSTTISIKRQE